MRVLLLLLLLLLLRLDGAFGRCGALGRTVGGPWEDRGRTGGNRGVDGWMDGSSWD